MPEVGKRVGRGCVLRDDLWERLSGLRKQELVGCLWCYSVSVTAVIVSVSLPLPCLGTKKISNMALF